MTRRPHTPTRGSAPAEARSNDDAGGASSGHRAAADTDVFADAMRDVVRLPPDPRGHAPRRPTVVPPPRARLTPAPMTWDAGDDGLADEFLAPGMDRRELRRLRRGEHAPTARLDLHGETSADAIEKVEVFLAASRRTHRVVCIVHGRGLHSPGRAVLKTDVRQHLGRHAAVLAWVDAPRADGGEGAVYVLLRR